MLSTSYLFRKWRGFCLHGLNAVYLKDYGWYRIDAYGNKNGIHADINPPVEKLAFVLGNDEYDLPDRYSEPLTTVVETLKLRKNYKEMIDNIPDIV